MTTRNLAGMWMPAAIAEKNVVAIAANGYQRYSQESPQDLPLMQLKLGMNPHSENIRGTPISIEAWVGDVPWPKRIVQSS